MNNTNNTNNSNYSRNNNSINNYGIDYENILFKDVSIFSTHNTFFLDVIRSIVVNYVYNYQIKNSYKVCHSIEIDINYKNNELVLTHGISTSSNSIKLENFNIYNLFQQIIKDYKKQILKHKIVFPFIISIDVSSIKKNKKALDNLQLIINSLISNMDSDIFLLKDNNITFKILDDFTLLKDIMNKILFRFKHLHIEPNIPNKKHSIKYCSKNIEKKINKSYMRLFPCSGRLGSYKKQNKVSFEIFCKYYKFYESNFVQMPSFNFFPIFPFIGNETRTWRLSKIDYSVSEFNTNKSFFKNIRDQFKELKIKYINYNNKLYFTGFEEYIDSILSNKIFFLKENSKIYNKYKLNISKSKKGNLYSPIKQKKSKKQKNNI